MDKGVVYQMGNGSNWRLCDKSSLKFINHAEGYLEPNGAGNYKYVYQYKDIWGNTRVTYADDNNNGVASPSEIRREQNYYPFGMEHRGYNNTLIGTKNNLKTFQQQEFTEDFGLNTHEWKYRMSDPSTGRFWQIDPLAADYPYNSTFAFQENKLGLGIELEGLELFPLPVNGDGAINAAKEYYSSIWEGVETTFSNAYQGASQLLSDPVGTVKSMAADHVDRITNPGRLMGDTMNAMNTVNPVAVIANDVAVALTSDNPVAALGNAQGERLANQTIEAAGVGMGAVAGKVVSGLSKTSGVSPNVQKVLNTLDEIKANGGEVKVNNLKSYQELNMTISQGSDKLNVRIETHSLPKKYGGDGVTPQRHLNVETVPRDKNSLPNGGHKLLDEQ